jgi:hypothetical protein
MATTNDEGVGRGDGRVVVWYSDGAASAVAARLAVLEHGDRCLVVKCDTTSDEHPDNLRFRKDVERWIGREVLLIRNADYAGVDDVFERERYMAGIAGARCTTELKKRVRMGFQRPDDIHVFGYTYDERKRAREFVMNNPELALDWNLIRRGITKRQCLVRLESAGIRLPEMYALGFEHNNCLGCVKATSPAYWNRTRALFPEVFDRRAQQSREIGARLVRINDERRFLDELPADLGMGESDGDIECGPFCHMPQDEMDFAEDAA